MFRLDGKLAVVTGGSRGLGRAMATGLAEQGAQVVLVARRQEWLDPAVAELCSVGFNVRGFQGDVTNPAHIGNLIAYCRKINTIDILVNCAGIARQQAASQHTMHAWDEVINTNLRGMFACCQAVSHGMIQRGYGNIINVASVVGYQNTNTYMQHAAYSASKAGVVGLTKELATAWGRYGIRVNAIAPGFFRTRMTDGALGAFHTMVSTRAPIDRLGQPSEIKGAAVFLAADESSYITGHTLVVDGGYSIA